MYTHLVRAMLVLVGAAFTGASLLHSFTYVTAGDRFSPDTVVHPIGYNGKGGVLEITVGLHPDYAYLEKDIAFSANQTVAIWNNLIPTTGNLQPSVEKFAEIASRQVASEIHNLKNTMGIMVGGGSLIPGLVRRGIGADDVAGIRYAMSGLDELQGTSDDYSINLKYVGVDGGADVVISFDKPDGNASAGISGAPIRGSDHKAMRTGRPIRYNPNLAKGRTWYFPVAESVPIEIAGKTGDTIKLRMATVKGKRYGIKGSSEPGTMDSLCRDLVVKVNGKLIPWTGAEYFFFVAKGRETKIEMNILENQSADAQFEACQLIGKPLVMK